MHLCFSIFEDDMEMNFRYFYVNVKNFSFEFMS